MSSMNLPRPVVYAIGAGFALVLLVAIWWSLNPMTRQRSQQYYKDAAKLQAEEANLPDAGGQTAPAPVASDKAYQPEKGNID